MANLRFRNLFLNGRWLVLFTILLIILAVIIEKRVSNIRFNSNDIAAFQSVLNSKEEQIEKLFSDIEEQLETSTGEELYSALSENYFDLFRKKGLSIYVYKDDSIVYWSDNSIPVPSFHYQLPDESLVKIGNSILVNKTHNYGNYDIEGFILIKSEYPYENKFLKNNFQKDFKLNKLVRVVQKDDEGEHAIYEKSGDYLFSLDLSFAGNARVWSLICISLYIISLVVFLTFLRRILVYSSPGYKNSIVLFYIPLLAFLYYVITWFRYPLILFDLDLFSPEKFARSAFLPSLGDLLFLALFGFFVAYNFYTEFHFKSTYRKSVVRRYISLIIISLVILLIYLINAFIFKSIIIDSSISFETYKVLDITAYTFIGFLVLLLLFGSFGLLTDKLFQIPGFVRESSLVMIIIIVLIWLVSFLHLDLSITPEIAVFYSLIVFLLWFFRFKRKRHYRFSTFVIYIFLFSIFTVYEVVRYTELKNKSEMKMIAVNLSAEHDPVAELLLVDIDSQLREDENIEDIIYESEFDFNELYNFIHRNYFSGYWDKYDLQITLCMPTDSVYVSPPEDSWYHCYNFFYEYVLENGIQVPNTDFYYLDNLNGRISYFATLCFEENSGNEVTLFIELDSKLISDGLGYPELLLEDRLAEDVGFSYAKYHNGRLITSSGDYAYSMVVNTYTDGVEGFDFVRFDKYDHKIYNIDGSNTIILSKPSIHWVDLLISFSYIFSFYFIILLIILVISGVSPVSFSFRWNFKTRIQIAMTSLLLFSLLLIGSGTVYFSIRQYKDRQTENLTEKIQSVYIELIHKLEYETSLHGWSGGGYYHLNELLQKFSNVFYTDINLFDETGQLLATSRSEIFELGLVADRMNAVAFSELTQNRRSEYIHNESIGDLKYLSAYVPLVNSENKLLAYLNLPYFTRQDELTREVTNLVVAIINIVMLLSLLSFTIAVILANRITQPLRLLQENLAKISLSEKNQKISYSGRDEIGSLVNVYNTMVEQILESAELLAKSERESAWREMAKQIAHEIKNPLTPMKLGIQHLQRTWKNGEKEDEEQIDRIVKIIIEQIDNLSSIATEFSNFAQMPVANNAEINVVDVLNDSVKLFEDENYNIQLFLNGNDQVVVYADKEQLNRVFINLIKNSIQAIPENTTPKIEIGLDVKKDKVIIRFKDNGKGIPPEVRDKLFQPNFTTKSSGMGMGLAIVQNVVRNAGGKVYYDTEMNKGSSFYVQLPLIKNGTIE